MPVFVIGFIIGLLIGCTIGIVLSGLLCAARAADDQNKRLYENKIKNQEMK